MIDIAFSAMSQANESGERVRAWHARAWYFAALARVAESSKGKALLGEKVLESIIGQRAAERRIRALARPDREVAP